MPVYGAGVAFWQECAAVKSGMLHGGGAACCPLALASDGLCGKWGGGCRYARDYAVKRRVWQERGSGERRGA